MKALEQLFQSLARDFNEGTFKSHLETMILPTTMYVADTAYFVPDKATLSNNFNIYRTNLMELGFARIEPEIVSISQSRSMTAKVTLKWNYFNTEDALFDSTILIYFCTKAAEGWRIIMVETPDRLDSKVIDGLPPA